MPHSPGPRALPARPDLSSLLLAAVGERDPQLARRLGQQWVHRRGLAALDTLLNGPLGVSQGPEARAWLLEVLELPVPAALVPAVPAAAAPGPGVARPATGAMAQPRRQRLALNLRPPAESDQPAPPPASLAALRAWLPDEQDLPHAC